MLEVYYRHLPIYENVYDNREVIPQGGDKDGKTETSPDASTMKSDADQPAKTQPDQPAKDSRPPADK